MLLGGDTGSTYLFILSILSRYNYVLDRYRLQEGRRKNKGSGIGDSLEKGGPKQKKSQKNKTKKTNRKIKKKKKNCPTHQNYSQKLHEIRTKLQ